MSEQPFQFRIRGGHCVAVRSFHAGDEQALWNMFYRSVHQLTVNDYTRQQRDIWAPVNPSEAWIARVQANKPLVAIVEKKVAGYADLQSDGYIDHFYVDPAFARRGVGRGLLGEIHELAHQRHLKFLYSNVSITARAFFEYSGFVVEAAQTVEREGVSFRNFRMVKQLRK